MKSLTTQLAGINVNMEEDVSIAILLKSLPLEEYGQIVTTLTNLPTPKLVDIVGSLMEEEKKSKKQGTVYSEAYYSRNTSRGATTKKFSKDKLKCHFCGKTGHFERDCFAKKKNGANMIEDHDEDQPQSEEASQEEANFIQNQSWGF